MRFRVIAPLAFGLLMALVLFTVISAASVTETEPNNSPGEANPLEAGDVMEGSIEPAGEADYFSQDGINTLWGFIALLDTSGSTASTAGALTALASDGTTVLQSDLGSWENGSGIALQNFADSSATHFLRVHEELDDQQINEYSLRYYETVVSPQAEVEPNESRISGNSSAFTMNGTISSDTDVDCFSFHGRAGDTILLALNGDPEGDGSTADLALEFLDPSDSVLKSANFSGAAGNEFIEYAGLPVEGVYAYCLALAAGAAGSGATYTAGLVRNGVLYFPAYEFGPSLENPRDGNVAYPGELLTFTLAITNTSPVAIPGDLNHRASYSAECLSFVGADPPETEFSPGQVSWDGLKNGLAPGEVYDVTLTLQAEKVCMGETLHHSLTILYFVTGAGDEIAFDILLPTYLPIVMQE